MTYLATAVAALALALVPLTAWRLRFLQGYPRSVWLSIGAGISVAYVFIFLLPELNEYQEIIAEETATPLGLTNEHVYLAALAGLLAFYGLEQFARISGSGRQGESDGAETGHKIFWVHTISYGVYNGLIGYLLLFQFAHSASTLVFFSIAMVLHFAVNDYAFRQHHRGDYSRYGQWILAAAVIVGWSMSVLVELPETTVALLLAFVFGGLIINLLKEELPEERSSHFWAFLLGAGLYAVLVIAI